MIEKRTVQYFKNKFWEFSMKSAELIRKRKKLSGVFEASHISFPNIILIFKCLSTFFNS